MVEKKRSNPRIFTATLVASLVVGVGGGLGAWMITYYESWDTVEFRSYSAGLTFVVHLRTDGPLTAHKDVIIGSLQVLGNTTVDMNKVRFTVRGINGRYDVTCTKDVGYVEREGFSEFWETSLCEGRIIFEESGVQNMSASLWTQPGDWHSIDPTGDDPYVYVLPKEIDDNWVSGRIAIAAAVMGIALVAIPSTAKTYRDLYLNK